MPSMLKVGGKVAIITFHSLEDRIVKDSFKELVTPPKIDRNIPILPNELPSANFELLNKKVIIATDDELNENNRSSSAKLRGITRIK